MLSSNLSTILSKIQRYHPKYIDLKLDRMFRILDDLGNPHHSLPPTIHIAGTNGKGSTIAFLRSMLENSDLLVHTYISPHLVRFNERIRLNGKLISDDFLYKTLVEVDRINNGKEITFFEITTAAAFLAFSSIKADILLLEVGLGGRLDATNVLPNILASVITEISFDQIEKIEIGGLPSANRPVFDGEVDATLVGGGNLRFRVDTIDGNQIKASSEIYGPVNMQLPMFERLDFQRVAPAKTP